MFEPGARRVRVVGNSGAGKSTFAKALAKRLDVPYLELDAMFWGPNWTQRPVAEARTALAEFLGSDAASAGWVIDGNWERSRGGLGDDADVTVWLDYSRAVVMSRVVRRTVWRGARRQELWHGNFERLGSLFKRDPDENIVLYSWTAHEGYRRRYRTRMRTEPNLIRLGSPRAARRLLADASR